MLEDVQGALWTRELIEEGRCARSDIPPLQRIVIAVDPAVSVSESSDETGIIAAGLGVDGHGYLLEDASGKFSPIEWARRAVVLYHRCKADRIVAEANQGGAMVETTIRTVDANVSFKAVHASQRQDHARRADRGSIGTEAHSHSWFASRTRRSTMHVSRPDRQILRTGSTRCLGLHRIDGRERLVRRLGGFDRDLG